MKLRALLLAIIVFVSVGMSAEVKPAETKNAALRYWIAFAEMRDVPTDEVTQALLEKTVSGQTAWDESKLGPILDANADAIDAMQRATKLPFCDWGLEYSRGAQASIAYAPRARALARLNALQGVRLMARGDSQSAVNTWLAGIHFSQDLSRGGTLIFALIANASLLPDLQLLTEAARNGQLSDPEKRQVSASIQALREDGFDWAAAWSMETWTAEQTLQELRSADDPGAKYTAIMGSASPKEGLPPTSEDIQKFKDYMASVESALGETPGRTTVLIEGLQVQRNKLGEVERNMIPSAKRVNAVRMQTMTVRTDLLRALDGK